ncbi:MAG: dihydrofolate reductase, partial [Adhaeribacter sp.]|nr:dihydrofolate reductase [Adhaeribacter sp.]
MYKKISYLSAFTLAAFLLGGCAQQTISETTDKNTDDKQVVASPAQELVAAIDTFKYATDQFADLRILRYQVPGFEELTTKQKELLYYLYEAALAGRDIIYDQNFKHNLRIRRTLDA